MTDRFNHQGVRLFGGTSRYYQGPDAIERLPDACKAEGGPVAIVIDADVQKLIGDRLEGLFADQDHVQLPFSGEVTVPAMERLATQTAKAGARLIVCIGGGKALDAGKGAAIRCGLRFMTAPTIASNDSPISMGLAVYDDNHNVAAIETHKRNPEAVFVDTRLIAGAPAQFLRAGIGDAIAKKFEAEASLRDGGLTAHFTRQLRTGLYIADGCYRTIREFGAAAVADAGKGEPTEALDAVVEANILMAGLSFENSGLGLAHALTRGLVRTPKVMMAPHGFHVAYGLLVQLAVEERSEAFLDDIARFYKEVGLPCSLRQLGLEELSDNVIEKIAANTTAAPKGAYLVVPVGAQRLVEAIRHIEARFGR